ncbi:sphingomyelin synthase family protein [Candidatus Kaiserbacteria bacterium]|nr:sphingomyelin synthase family protein [Candidatus Kaiserbacteria bacterium]
MPQLRELYDSHSAYWRDMSRVIPALASIAAFAAGVFADYGATIYASARASNSVTDIILSNTPVYDVDGFFVYGAMALIVFIFGVCVLNPRRIPFTLYSLAVLFFIRAAFITLTHLGPFPDQTSITASESIGIYFSKFFFGDDLFFSNHTAIPYMMALVYWHRTWLRYIFLAWSVAFAITVLLGHIHYSIDVASAYFITYSIYRFAIWAFPREYALFHEYSN